MKKILLLILTALLVVSFSSIFVSAEDTINPDGYTFDIKALNGAIGGEDGIIISKQDAIANANLKWPIIIICQKVADNVYKVKSDPVNPGGTAPSLTLGKDEIIIAIHSAASDVKLKDTYKNVEQKVAAINVKAGMYFKLQGIDIAAGTCTNGKAVCSAKAPGNVSEPAASSAVTSSEAASSAASETSSEASSTAATSAVSSVAASKAESSGASSEMPTDDGLSTTTIVIIVAAAVAVIGAVAVIMMKKKK